MLEFVSMNEEKAFLIISRQKRLERKMNRIRNIDRLVNRRIDRKFHLDLNALTPSELDFEMGRRAANLKENADPRVWLNMKAGGSKPLKFLLIPVFFFRLIFIKPVSIIRDFIFFNNALLVRMRNTDARLSDLENRAAAAGEE